MPISRSSCTVCWVGFGLELARGGIQGTGQVDEGDVVGLAQRPSWRIGLEEGQGLDVAHRAADLDDGDVHVLVAPRLMNSWISLVTCGITCTVLPR